MKKILIVAIAIMTFAANTFAQDAKKSLKNASKELAQYYQDPINNAGKLETALQAVTTAFSDDMIKADPESWLVRGDIYNSIANAETNLMIINKDYKPKTPNAGLMAAEAFKKTIELAVKKNHTKDAIKGLQEAENNLSNAGINAYQSKDLMAAFKNFKSYLEVAKLLQANKAKSKLDVDTLKSEMEFYTIATGYEAKADDSELLPLLTEMYNAKSDKPIVYQVLFNIKAKTDEAEALKVLEQGRQKFPDDSSLLFDEINYYLGKGKLDILVDKLKMAIAKEPNNVTVYNTLGNVYDQLVAKERTAGNASKVKEYFDAAFDYYNQATKIDPKNFDSAYSLGALYYNKAAGYTAELNKLSNDYSKDGTKKYNALKAEMDGVFDQALPYFLKAEGLDAKDTNTMIALKEIYARKGNLEKAAEYKKKLEAAGK